MEYNPSDYIDLFYEEADEYLEYMTSALLRLEKEPKDEAALEELFRGAHSFKGGAAAVGFNHISKLAHHMEDVLQRLRDKEIIINSKIVDTLFESFDILKKMLASLQSQEEESAKNKLTIEADVMRKALEAVKGGQEVEEAGDEKEGATATRVAISLKNDELQNALELKGDGNEIYLINVELEKDTPMISARVFLISSNLLRHGEIVKCNPDLNDLSEEMNEYLQIIFATSVNEEEITRQVDIPFVANQKIEIIDDIESFRYLPGAEEIANMDSIIEVMTEQEERIREEERNRQQKIAAEKPVARREIKKSTVRVDIDKLDTLLNLVAELVINRGQALELGGQLIGHTTQKDKMSSLFEIIQAQGIIINQFQEAIMTARLVPIGQVFQRFPRIVRDLARDRGKEIELDIKGEETELDKKIIDEIGEPLTHLVRNSIDHGIETVEDRKAAGKPEQGRILFSAYYESNNIVIEVKDDGRGINIGQVKAKILERELATEEELAKLSEKEILKFIFKSGFSTADQISDISGRGVGMDVVRRKVESLNGEIEIVSEMGVGTTMLLKLPLTLAIIQALLVGVENEKYALPITNVVETIRLNEGDIFTVKGKGRVIRVRDDIIALLQLDEILGVKRNGAVKQKRSYVAVVSAGGHQVGLMVDKMISEQEVVIKSLDSSYKKAEYLAGASILGDGSVCLILDSTALVKTANA